MFGDTSRRYRIKITAIFPFHSLPVLNTSLSSDALINAIDLPRDSKTVSNRSATSSVSEAVGTEPNDIAMFKSSSVSN